MCGESSDRKGGGEATTTLSELELIEEEVKGCKQLNAIYRFRRAEREKGGEKNMAGQLKIESCTPNWPEFTAEKKEEARKKNMLLWLEQELAVLCSSLSSTCCKPPKENLTVCVAAQPRATKPRPFLFTNFASGLIIWHLIEQKCI